MDSDRIRLHTKSGAEYTERLPGMVENFKRLPMRSAIINGELCLVAADGLPRFYWLLHDAHALAGRNGQDVFRFRSASPGRRRSPTPAALRAEARFRSAVQAVEVAVMTRVDTFSNGEVALEKFISIWVGARQRNGSCNH